MKELQNSGKNVRYILVITIIMIANNKHPKDPPFRRFYALS